MNHEKSPPLAGGDLGEGDQSGVMAPSPQPSPVKGEGERVNINVYFGVYLVI